MCGPGQVAKKTLGRPHMSFRGLKYGPRQLVDRVEDVVVNDLCGVYHGSSIGLVAPLLSLFSSFSSDWFRDGSGSTPGVYVGSQPSIPYRCTSSIDMSLVVQLRRDCEHHADALESGTNNLVPRGDLDNQ